MEFFRVIDERRSVRLFLEQPVEADKLQNILEAANRAPSAGNLQAYEIYVVRNARKRAVLARAALDQEFIAQAPLVFVFCAHSARSRARYGDRGVNLYCVQDATIACSFAMLAATALGLSSVWVGAFDEEQVRCAINAPASQRPVAILPIGYPGECAPLRNRRALKDLVHEV